MEGDINMASKFEAFLKGNVERLVTKPVIISDRFRSEDGKLVPFVIKALSTQKEKAIRKNCKKIDDMGREVLDTAKYEDEVTLACVIEPNLSNAELQDSYGVMGEIELLNEMLLSGEYMTLQKHINEMNGVKSFDQKVEEAKN